MLDRLREGIKSTWAKVILGLIIASFIFAGVGTSLLNTDANTVAKVNGEEITRQDFDTQYQQDRNRIGEQFAQVFNTDAKIQQFQSMVLERLIMNKLVEQANSELGVFVGQSIIKEQIKNTPQFQIDGRYDEDTFRNLLARNGWTVSSYENKLRQDMESRQLSAVMDSEFALDTEVDAQLSLQGQTRSGKYLNIDASLLQASIGFEGEEGEKELTDYYQKNINSYVVPEKIIVEYIELSADNIKPEITDEEVNSYYKEHLSDYGIEEERQASHILISVASGADESTLAEAQKKIDTLAEKIKQGGDFAEIATNNSEDRGSAEEGGELGYFGKNVMDPAFEETVFALTSVNDVSAVVRSNFGFHLIKLTGIKAAQQKPLEEVKEDVEKAFAATRLDELFIEANNIVTEKAFEINDSLEEVAEASGLKVGTSEAFPASGGSGLFLNPAVLEAAFSAQVMVDGYNSDVISLGLNHAVVLRLKERIESQTMSFEDVKPRLETNLRREMAQLKSVKYGEQIIAAVQQGTDLSETLSVLPDSLKASWIDFTDVGRNDAILTQQVRTQLFKMSKPTITNNIVNQGFATFNGYSLIQLQKVNAGVAEKSTPEQKKQVQLQLAKEWSLGEDKALQEWLKSNAEIQRMLLPQNTQN